MTPLEAFAPYLLAFARCSAFAATAPPLVGRAVPPIARAALAMALTPLTALHSSVPAHCCDTANLLAVGLPQAAIGASFGLTASAVAGAANAAGGMIDAAVAQPPLPVDNTLSGSAGVMGRLYPLAFAATFFGGGGFAQLVERFADFPSDPGWGAMLAPHAVAALGRECFRAAVDIAWPALSAAFVATLVGGTLARLVPRLNGLFVATPVTAALTLAAVGVGAHALFIRFTEISQASAGVAALIAR